MQVSLSSFKKVDLVECDFCPSHVQPLGFQVEQCPHFLCAYVSAFNHPFGPQDVVTANHQCLGGCILKVGEHCTFTPDDVQAALQPHASLLSPPKTLSVLIAQDSCANLSDPPSLCLCPINIRHATALLLVTGEGDVAHQCAALHALSSVPSNGATPPDPDNWIEDGAKVRNWSELRELVNDHMMEEEKALPLFTFARTS